MTVTDRSAGGGLASLLQAGLFPQPRMDALPGSVVAPGAEIAPDGGPGWEVVWQGAPLAAWTIQVQNGVEYRTQVGRTRTSPELGLREEWFENRPVAVGQITGVPWGWCLSARLWGESLPALPHRGGMPLSLLVLPGLSCSLASSPLPPAMPGQEAIDRALIDRLLHLRLQRLLDLGGRRHVPLCGAGQVGLQEGAFLLECQVLMATPTFARRLYRLHPTPVVG